MWSYGALGTSAADRMGRKDLKPQGGGPDSPKAPTDPSHLPHQDRSDHEVEKIKSALILCYGFVAAHAPRELLLSRVEADILRNISQYFSTKVGIGPGGTEHSGCQGGEGGGCAGTTGPMDGTAAQCPCLVLQVLGIKVETKVQCGALSLLCSLLCAALFTSGLGARGWERGILLILSPRQQAEVAQRSSFLWGFFLGLNFERCCAKAGGGGGDPCGSVPNGDGLWVVLSDQNTKT